MSLDWTDEEIARFDGVRCTCQPDKTVHHTGRMSFETVPITVEEVVECWAAGASIFSLSKFLQCSQLNARKMLYRGFKRMGIEHIIGGKPISSKHLRYEVLGIIEMLRRESIPLRFERPRYAHRWTIHIYPTSKKISS